MDRDEDKREPYESPSIEDLPLYPSENVLLGCKLGSGPANSTGGFGLCHHPGGCSNPTQS